MLNSFVNSSIKSIILLLAIATPLGTPVDPEVKLIYTGSISNLFSLILFNSSSFIFPVIKSSTK